MKKVSALALSSLAYIGFAGSALAAGTGDISVNPCPTGNFSALCSLTADGQLINSLITLAFIVASLIALAFLIFGGIKWITSGGDKGGVEAARNMIVASLVGLVIVFLSYLILNFVFAFFGLGTIGAFNIPSLNAGK